MNRKEFTIFPNITVLIDRVAAPRWVNTYSVTIQCNKYTTLNKQNTHTCSLGIYIAVPHRAFLLVSARNGSSSGNQTELIPHKTKLAAFVHS